MLNSLSFTGLLDYIRLPVNSIDLVLDELSDNLFFVAHSFTLATSDDSFSLSLSTQVKSADDVRVVSSANRSSPASVCRCKSFINIINKSGPSIDLWRTPATTALISDH